MCLQFVLQKNGVLQLTRLRMVHPKTQHRDFTNAYLLSQCRVISFMSTRKVQPSVGQFLNNSWIIKRCVVHNFYTGKCGQYWYKVWWIFPDVLQGLDAFVLVSWSIKTSGHIHPSHNTYTAVRTPNPAFSLFIPTCMITRHGRWLHIVIHCYLPPLCKCTEIWSP